MGSPADFRPAPGTIPTKPGVYRFRDSYGRVIYVGKAKNLRNRLNSYFCLSGECTLAISSYAEPGSQCGVDCCR